MKKIFAFAMAAIAMSFASCGSKTASNTAELDSVACDTAACAECPKGAAQQVVALLQEQIENANPEQIKSIGATIAEKVSQFLAKGDNEAVQTYTAVISNFIAENADKLKEIGASSSITEALSKVEGIPTDIIETATQAVSGVKSAALTSAMEAIAKGESVTDAIKAAAGEVISDGADAAAAAQEAVEAAPEAAKEAAKAKVEEVKDQAADAAGKAVDDAAAAAKKSLGL